MNKSIDSLIRPAAKYNTQQFFLTTFLHLLNHALKGFSIEVFKDFIIKGIHFLIRTSFQE